MLHSWLPRSIIGQSAIALSDTACAIINKVRCLSPQKSARKPLGCTHLPSDRIPRAIFQFRLHRQRFGYNVSREHPPLRSSRFGGLGSSSTALSWNHRRKRWPIRHDINVPPARMFEHRSGAAYIKKTGPKQWNVPSGRMRGHTEKEMGAHTALHELPQTDGSVPLPYCLGVDKVVGWPWNCGFDEE